MKDKMAAQRRAAGAFLEHVPEGTLAERTDAARYIVQEKLLHDALEEAKGSRTGAAALLGVPDERVAEALKRHPHLAQKWPAKRGRPPKVRT